MVEAASDRVTAASAAATCSSLAKPSTTSFGVAKWYNMHSFSELWHSKCLAIYFDVYDGGDDDKD